MLRANDLDWIRDFKGQRLCVNCWNGHHYVYSTVKKTGQNGGKIANCLQGNCECECTALLEEKHPRVKPDKSAQLEITTEDVLLFEDGKPEPRLENMKDGH